MEAISADEIESKLQEFKSWISNQHDLPQNTEEILLLRFLKVAKWRVEKAQRFFRHSIQMRTSNPLIFSQRDPMSQNIQKVFDVIDMVPLPNPTSNNYKLIIMRLISDDIDDLNFNDVIKFFFMISDIRLITPDGDQDICDGEIAIFDMDRVSYRHLSKVVLSTLRLYMKYTQEAHPVHVKQIHIINCNPIIDKIVYLIKPFIRAENYKMNNFHTKGADTLFKYIGKEYLPVEYGGSAGSVVALKNLWRDKIISYSDYLINDDNWKLKTKHDDENNNSSKAMELTKTALDFLI